MLLKEINLSFLSPNSLDKQGVPISYPNYYKEKKIGASKKVRAETITMRDSKTGKVYGMRTIFQKAT